MEDFATRIENLWGGGLKVGKDGKVTGRTAKMETDALFKTMDSKLYSGATAVMGALPGLMTSLGANRVQDLETLNQGPRMSEASLTAVDAPVASKYTIDQEASEDQSRKAALLTGAGSIASMIPGVGGFLGAGLSMLGGSMGAQGPVIDRTQRKNTSQFGNAYKYGGKRKMKTAYVSGGRLQSLSSEGVEVKANEPSKTDSVDLGNAMVDDKEVLVDDKVFTNSIKDPEANKEFAALEKMNQKAMNRYQKLKTKTGDTEYEDEKHYKRNTEQLFQRQERLANMLGLRDQQGMPVQEEKGNFKYGGKMKYEFGGPGDPPVNKGIFDLIKYAMKDPKSYQNYWGAGGQYAKQKDPSKTPIPLTDLVKKYQGPVGGLLGSDFDLVDGNKVLGIENADAKLSNFLELTRQRRASLFNEIIPSSGLPLFGNTAGTPAATPQTTTPTTTTQPSSGTQEGSEGENNKNKKSFYTSAAPSNFGIFSNVANMMTNRPDYVSYDDVGRPELQQQELALREMKRGEAGAIMAARRAGNVGRSQVEARSQQVKNANLRNISAGQANQEAKIYGDSARAIAGMRGGFGQRRTAIQQANLQKDMMTDEINTKEKDSVKTENMRMQDNIRKLMIEKQLLQNTNANNQLLSGLLNSEDFNFDPTTGKVTLKDGRTFDASQILAGYKTTSTTTDGQGNKKTRVTTKQKTNG